MNPFSTIELNYLQVRQAYGRKPQNGEGKIRLESSSHAQESKVATTGYGFPQVKPYTINHERKTKQLVLFGIPTQNHPVPILTAPLVSRAVEQELLVKYVKRFINWQPLPYLIADGIVPIKSAYTYYYRNSLTNAIEGFSVNLITKTLYLGDFKITKQTVHKLKQPSDKLKQVKSAPMANGIGMEICLAAAKIKRIGYYSSGKANDSQGKIYPFTLATAAHEGIPVFLLKPNSLNSPSS
jgi:hypothetical protein